MSGHYPSAYSGSKRKRTETGASLQPAAGTVSFVERVAAVEDQFVEMLKNCQKHIINAERSVGACISFRAGYSFRKNMQDIGSPEMNCYGIGKLEGVDVSVTGETVLPLPAWMDSGVTLKASFDGKMQSTRPHSSGDPAKHGVEIPWRARLQLKSIPSGCMVESVRLAFILPGLEGLQDHPTAKLEVWSENAGNLYFINDNLMHMHGQAYSECDPELEVFRLAVCCVKLRVPLRLLICQQLKPLWDDFPVNAVPTTPTDYSGQDNVTLKCQKVRIKVDRQLLHSLSAETEVLFGRKKLGRVRVFALDVGEEVVQTLLQQATAKTDYFPLDPFETAPTFLYELFALAMEWNVRPLKVWTQIALLQRLSMPGFDLQCIPMEDVVQFIQRDFNFDHAQTGVRMALLGFTFVLRDMLGVRVPDTIRYPLRYAIREISSDPALLEIFQPEEFMQVLKDWQWERRQADSSANDSIRVSIRFMNGAISLLTISKHDSVRDMKAEIESRHAIPVQQQCLYFAGVRLDDDQRTIADCNVPDGGGVRLVEKLVC